MRHLQIALALLIALTGAAIGQTSVRHDGGAYPYTTVNGDMMGVRIYKLKNGLTVMLSVNNNEPRVQTMIATAAGSKNDPAGHTGLAHYLEHMLFKGTDTYGTKDWAKESVYIEQINNLYEKYNHTTNETERAQIYRQIDSVSGVAATYAIPNEYDKMVANIGAQGTNAFTSVESTVYVNDIPTNQIETWLKIESERFRMPVFRLFHTELEAVYEEKNISLDNDFRKAYEQFNAGLFRNHSYGTQTTLGTIEHLKNPSLLEIRKFYDTYYVPNNMAVIMSGDFDPDQAIALIDKYMGQMKSKPVPAFTFQPEKPQPAPQVYTVYGNQPENLMMGFRFPGLGTRDALLLELTDLLLAYKGAGLIDINIVQAQKAQEAGSSPDFMKDYSVHRFSGTPKQGQKLEEVKDLILAQIDKIKRGQFDESTLKACLKNLKVDRIKQFEDNGSRAYEMLAAFIGNVSWDNYAVRMEAMARFTKKDIVDFANKYYGNDYVVVYKRQGEDKNVLKVSKPPITPVAINRDAMSPFTQSVMSAQAQPIRPVFADYKTQIAISSLKNGTPLLYSPNKENNLFSMSYVLQMGRKNNRALPLAVGYLKYLGAGKYTADQVSRQFFNLGCSFNVAAGEDMVTLTVSGLQESFEPAVKLFEQLLNHPKPNQAALNNLVEQELKGRQDAKQSKGAIRQALNLYAVFGPKNRMTDNLTEGQLKSLKAADLCQMAGDLTNYQHEVLYYGPESADKVGAALNKLHRMNPKPKAIPAGTEYARREITQNEVLFAHYDKMVQAEITWLTRTGPYTQEVVPPASMFNAYFGDGMSAVVFQTIRESKALAYSTAAMYSTPARKEDPCYMFAYIGTQADKLPDAIPAMNELLTTLPRTQAAFESAKAGLRKQIETQRILHENVLTSYLGARKMGLDHDIRQDVYQKLGSYTLDDVQKFHEQNVKGRPYVYTVVGARDKVDMNTLGKYGTVREVTLQELFGY